jgi:F420-non-reducing hydrogenase small subunit
MKATVSTEWLSGCSGCHVAIVDLHEKLINLVDEVQFVRVPVLMDEKGYPKADVGIVEGAVRSEHDRHALLEMRKSCKKLLAFGTCAVYGGPSGIGWLYGRDAILDKAYGGNPTDAKGSKPPSASVKLEESVIPIDEVVDVDMYLSGCPPHPFYIAAAVRELLGAKTVPLDAKTVCSECERRMKKVEKATLKRGEVTAPDAETCLLSQGVVCLGSVTLNRCKAQCPNKGIACAGCAGPSVDLIREPHLDIRSMVATRMNLLTGIDEQEIRQYIQADARTFYAYALSSPIMYRKPTVEIREWASGDGK